MTLLTDTGDAGLFPHHHPAVKLIAMCQVDIVAVDKRDEAATTVIDLPNVAAAAILLPVYQHLHRAAPVVPRLPASRDRGRLPLVAAAIHLR